MMIWNVNDMKTREKLKSLSVRKQDKGVHISSPEKKKSFGIKTFIINCITPGWQFSFSLFIVCDYCKQCNTYETFSVLMHAQAKLWGNCIARYQRKNHLQSVFAYTAWHKLIDTLLYRLLKFAWVYTVSWMTSFDCQIICLAWLLFWIQAIL